MTIAAGAFPLLGAQPVTNSTAIGVEVAPVLTGYTPLIPIGTITNVVDPYWGGLELIRLLIPAGNSIRVGTLSTLTSNYAFVAVPNTANLGQSLVVSFNDVPNNATFAQYAWFVMSGRYPILANVGLTADSALGIAAVGQAGTNSAGKQILNARVQIPSTQSVGKNGNTKLGSAVITVNNTDGWYVGGAMFGVGIPATTSIGAISADGTTVSLVALNTTTPQPCTATGFVALNMLNADGTPRAWNTCTFNRPLAQGAIT